jgi:hypothetical protein
VVRRVFGRDRRDRKVEASTNDLGDHAHRDALFSDSVQPSAGRRRLEREAEQACRVEAVDSRPAVGAATGIPGRAGRSCDLDQSGDEAVVAFAVD